jgi:nucleoside-diphosphate-sugar epimerase
MEVPFLILGAGYTGNRVAARLRAQGHSVFSTSGRQPDWTHLPPGTRVLYSVPPAEGEHDRLALLRGVASRVVYLSSTSVYGGQHEVDETTPPAPRTEREWNRIRSEEAILVGPWSPLVLRPAAIYGPGRGVHLSLRAGKYRLTGDGSNFVSRIHVDDLAALCAAALLSDRRGAWPVADLEPCTQLEIVRFCCGLLNLPLPPPADSEEQHETLRANRRVDGRAAFRLLGVPLQYPSYRDGIPASLATS